MSHLPASRTTAVAVRAMGGPRYLLGRGIQRRGGLTRAGAEAAWLTCAETMADRALDRLISAPGRAQLLKLDLALWTAVHVERHRGSRSFENDQRSGKYIADIRYHYPVRLSIVRESISKRKPTCPRYADGYAAGAGRICWRRPRLGGAWSGLRPPQKLTCWEGFGEGLAHAHQLKPCGESSGGGSGAWPPKNLPSNGGSGAAGPLR
jgi:hypothetical protein